MNQVEFFGNIDWDKAFTQLKMIPFQCSSETIGRQCPRQTFQMWKELNEWRKVFEVVAGVKPESKPDSTPAEPIAPTEQPKRKLSAYEKLEENAKPEEKQIMSGVKIYLDASKVGGNLGMQKYSCWSLTDAEKAETEAGRNPWLDPFVVPRSRCYERFAAMVLEQGRAGRLQPYDIPPGNDEACQNYIKQAWAINSQNFAGVEKAASEPSVIEGMKIIVEMANAGRLASYNVPQKNEQAALAFLTHIRECYARKIERDTIAAAGEQRS